ncbi:hypothetical protein S7335_1258 [Synechococcus sp. PCC 7335]|uniref:hypothetical protein n=1 Tax=Synechococcus sp. (strain ATCC 29403 / PCC 7335) TaxID=91464 RepID=UPI00017EE13D|nr:hypothetical protein [Synechococcus sp. PCC 7335]EDX82554.1 hypothetical protein S7335_1258 [Synechococcus sp. PCC 7335]
MVNEQQYEGSTNSEAELYDLLELLSKKSKRVVTNGDNAYSQSSSVSAIFNVLESANGKNSRFLTKLGNSIKQQERIIQQISSFPLDVRLSIEESLKHKIATRKATLSFFLGNADVTLLYLAILLLWTLDIGLFHSDIPSSLMVVVTTAIAVVYPLRILLFHRVQQLELMVHCLECAKVR